jgi:hypothetical protein
MYDNMLGRSFHGKVTIELLNQLEDKNHYGLSFDFDDLTPLKSKSRLVGKQRATTDGWGIHRFISHKQLILYKFFFDRQYLKDDTLYFRVSVEVTSNTKPWLV